jgi:hypothetical protein
MLFATRLIWAYEWGLIAFRSYVTQAFTEATPAELGGTAEEVD